MKGPEPGYSPELSQLCTHVKSLIEERKFSECSSAISEAMRNYPHAPHPHNLMGILLELEGDRLSAMKHFRAAWALDPSYLPCRINLDRCGSFFGTGSCAFFDQDCSEKKDFSKYKVLYDEFGIGHAKRQV